MILLPRSHSYICQAVLSHLGSIPGTVLTFVFDHLRYYHPKAGCPSATIMGSSRQELLAFWKLLAIVKFLLMQVMQVRSDI